VTAVRWRPYTLPTLLKNKEEKKKEKRKGKPRGRGKEYVQSIHGCVKNPGGEKLLQATIE
jgi:hypothetical protein